MYEIVKLYVHTPPPPLWPRVTRWWIEPAYVGWSSSWWLGIGLAVWVGVMNLGEAPSVANFGERWPLAFFCASKPLFWLITWWSFRIWCGGKPICGGALFYRRFPVKVASSLLCAANPPGLVRVVFLAVSPGCFLAVSPGCFLAVSPGCFLAVSPGCFLAVSPGLLLTVSSGGFWLVFARVCFPDVRQCVIAQDRASLNIEQVN